jgi:hypothetical protein
MVSRASVGEGQFEASKVFDGAGNDGRGLEPPPFSVKSLEHSHGQRHRMVGELRGGVRPRIPPSPRSVPAHEVVVTAPKTRGAKGGEHRQLVCGVVRGAQDREQVSDVLGAPQHGGTLEPVRDPRLLERLLE